MKCRNCRYYLSLTERDRDQRYCNGCEKRAAILLSEAICNFGAAELLRKIESA